MVGEGNPAFEENSFPQLVSRHDSNLIQSSGKFSATVYATSPFSVTSPRVLPGTSWNLLSYILTEKMQ